MENRAFNEMLKAARSWLSDLDPEEIARRTGAEFDGAQFALRSLGKAVRISYPGYEVEPALDYWHQLVILHYLYRADGRPSLNRPISFSQLPEGMIRGGGFDRDSAAALSAFANGRSAAEIEAALTGLGGRLVPSNADICAVLDFLPGLPVTVKLYLADDEFPAEGRMLLDESAAHYLPVEDAVTAGMVILEALK